MLDIPKAYNYLYSFLKNVYIELQIKQNKIYTFLRLLFVRAEVILLTLILLNLNLN